MISGENFVAIVTSDVMSTMAEIARDLLMSHTLAQWLYVISDTDIHKGNLSALINSLYEGENVAYIYNVTDDDPDCRVSTKKWWDICAFGLNNTKPLTDICILLGRISYNWEVSFRYPEYGL